MDLQTAFFLLTCASLAGYLAVGGAALGIGVLGLLTRSADERRLEALAALPLLAVGAVWLLAAGGLLLLGFPRLPADRLVAALVALLVLRAVGASIAARAAGAGAGRLGTVLFGWGSLAAVLLLGLAAGAALGGALLSPYSLAIALLVLVAVVMHGAAVMAAAGRGELQQRMARWAIGAWLLTLLGWLATGVWTLGSRAGLVGAALDRPLFWLFAILVLGSLASVPRNVRRLRYGRVAGASTLLMVSLPALTGAVIYPALIAAGGADGPGLTMSSAAADDGTLRTLLLVAGPLLLLLVALAIGLARRARVAARI